MRIAWVASVASVLGAAGGCGAKKAGSVRDCEGYANKVADLGDPAPGKRDSVVQFSRDLCERGRIRDPELACVVRATGRDQLIECTTGRPATHVADAAPPPPGTSAVTLVAMENGQGFHPIDLEHDADQRTWFEAMKKDVAACAGDEIFDPPRQYVLVVTYGPKQPAIDLAGLPVPVVYCINEILLRPHPNSVGNGPTEVTIDLGR